MKVPVLVLDTPNANNRIYPKEVVEKAIAKYRKEFIEEKRALVVSRLPESSTIDLRDVIGTVNEMTIEDGKVMVDVQFLPELKGAIAAEIGIANGKFALRTSGVGSTRRDEQGNNVVQPDWELCSCFVTDTPA
jgi:hypothetical protein